MSSKHLMAPVLILIAMITTNCTSKKEAGSAQSDNPLLQKWTGPYNGVPPFDKIKVEMSGFAPNQTPQAEGQLDYVILGGNISGKQEYYKVDKWNSNNSVTINGGELLGLFVKTKVAFYDIDTKDISKAKAKATGVITSTTLVSAEITLDNPLEKTAALGSWIFVTEKNFGNIEVKVKKQTNSSNCF